MISVIIPAYNEEEVIGACLHALALQVCERNFEVLVVINGSTDSTMDIATGCLQHFVELGKSLSVYEIDTANKASALNFGDSMAIYDCRLYLDADVICSPKLLAEILSILDTESPRYASGKICVDYGGSFVGWAYAQVWGNTSYIRDGVPGCGCYAVNASGRKLWSTFPLIHSDDKFVRLQFTPEQRAKVDAEYVWPVPKTIHDLIRVRARWISGNMELQSLFPALIQNDDNRVTLSTFVFMIRHPIVGFLFAMIYISAYLLALPEYLIAPSSNWYRATNR